MEQSQSIAILLSLLALAAAPGVLMWARRRDAEPQPNPHPTPLPEGMLTGRQAVAHHLYGQAVGWAPDAMADYDASPQVQATWLREADIRLR